jgi:protein-disulfide isomerase
MAFAKEEIDEKSTKMLYALAALVLLGFILGSAAVWLTADEMKASALSYMQNIQQAQNNKNVNAAGEAEGNLLKLQIGGKQFSREILGKADAPITIAEFSDFQCPFCMQVMPTIAQLEKKYEGKIKLVHMNFVVHPAARLAALAAECAGEQGRYWQMHDAIFSQKKYDQSGLAETAKSIGLDASKFSACLSSGKYEDEIDKQQEAGIAQGVEGTPTFIIGKIYDGKLVGKAVVGALPIQEFEREIEAALNS